MRTPGIKVAIGSEFLTAFARLPGRQQSKVSQFLEKFRSNPMAPGINYEKMRVAKDPNLRSVRIDQTYRGIGAWIVVIKGSFFGTINCSAQWSSPFF